MTSYKDSSGLNQEDCEKGKRESDTPEQVEKGMSAHLSILPPGRDVLFIQRMTRPARTELTLLNDVLKPRKPSITDQSSLKIITIFIGCWWLQKEYMLINKISKHE